MDTLGIRLLALALALVRIKCVTQDREQPSAHIRARCKAFDMGPSLHDRILHHVIGKGDIAGQADGKSPQRRQMRGQGIAHLV